MGLGLGLGWGFGFGNGFGWGLGLGFGCGWGKGWVFEREKKKKMGWLMNKLDIFLKYVNIMYIWLLKLVIFNWKVNIELEIISFFNFL